METELGFNILAPMVVSWLVLSLFSGFLAKGKGRSFVAFFSLSILLSPLIGILSALLCKSEESINKEAASRGEVNATHRPCPFCAESIRAVALVCPNCHGDLSKLQVFGDISNRIWQIGIVKEGGLFISNKQQFDCLEDALANIGVNKIADDMFVYKGRTYATIDEIMGIAELRTV